MLQESGNVIVSSFSNLWYGIISFIPNLIIALIIFIVGWIFASLIARAVVSLFKAAKVDGLLKKTGIDETLAKAGMVLDSGKFIAGLVKWFVIVAFLIASFDVLHLAEVNSFLKGVVIVYLPRVIAAALILLIAIVIADVVQRVVSSSAKAAELKHANFIGSVVKWVVSIVGVLASLAQLGIAGDIIQTLFTGVVVALSIAVGLAFGLGGQNAAAGVIEKLRSDISEKR